MRHLNGKVAIVTGASRGVGPVLAAHLHQAGARLALVARGKEGLEVTAAALREAGGEAHVFPADLQDARARAAMVTQVVDQMGGVHVLVNNAGAEHYGELEKRPFSEPEEVIAVNIQAPLHLAYLVLPQMLRQGEGHIVNIASTAGLGGLPYAIAYGASKAALIAMSNGLRLEFGPRGVSASALIPGYIRDKGLAEMHEAITGGAVRPSSFLGRSTPEAVARGLVKVISRDMPELIVNPRPIRFSNGLGRWFPRLGLWLIAKLSIPYTRAVAQARHAADRRRAAQ
jgi:short-subunit dehydrogenase